MGTGQNIGRFIPQRNILGEIAQGFAEDQLKRQQQKEQAQVEEETYNRRNPLSMIANKIVMKADQSGFESLTPKEQKWYNRLIGEPEKPAITTANIPEGFEASGYDPNTGNISKIERIGISEWKPTTKEEALELASEKAKLKAPTQGQETVATYASRVKQANDIFDSLEKKGYINNLPVVGTYLSGKVPNFMRDPNYQSYDQAQRNFVNAVLRRESGAVISPSEFENARLQYFPQPGDSKNTLEQKKANRDLVMKSFISAARGAYVPYDESLSQQTEDLSSYSTEELMKIAGL